MPEDSYDPYLSEQERINRERIQKDISEAVHKGNNDTTKITLKSPEVTDKNKFHPKFCPNCGHKLE